MKLFAIFAVSASAIDLTTLALLQNGQNGFAKVSFYLGFSLARGYPFLIGSLKMIFRIH